PIGKVLIEAADRDAGALGHPRGGEFAIPHRRQNLNACVEKRGHGCFRTSLNWPFSRLERLSQLCRHECEFQKHEGSFTLAGAVREARCNCGDRVCRTAERGSWSPARPVELARPWSGGSSPTATT